MIEPLYLSYLPTPLVVLFGLAFLWERRARGRRAATMGSVALLAIGGTWLFGLLFRLTWPHWIHDVGVENLMTVLHVHGIFQDCVNAVCVLLLVFAVMVDRGPGSPGAPTATGPATDYDDEPAGPGGA